MMTINEAFETLGLSNNADEKEIKEAHYKLSKQHHPDLTKGDPELQIKINNAYEKAKAFSKIKDDVSLIKPNELIGKIENSLATHLNFTKADELAQKIETKTSKKLQRLKSLSWIIGAICGTTALLAKDILALFLSNDLGAIFQPILASVTIFFGLFGLYLQLIVTRIQQQIDFFLEDIYEKKVCASRLAEHLNFEDDEIFQESDLISLTTDKEKKSSFINKLLFQDEILEEKLKSVLIAKSKEHGLIEIVLDNGISLDFVQNYRLLFKPSKFKKVFIKKESFKPEFFHRIILALSQFFVASLMMAGIAYYTFVAMNPKESYQTTYYWIGFTMGMTAGVSLLVLIQSTYDLTSNRKN